MTDQDPDEATAARASKAEQLREWKRNNPDKVKQYRETFRERHGDRVREQNREYMRAQAEKARKEREKRDAARERARQWYAENRDRHLEYQREYRARKRAEDPEAYREAKKERNRRWYARAREDQTAKAREKHKADPSVKREQAARYYADHAEEVKARRRAYYAANREAELEKQRQWRAREKRRVDAGLPPRRLHRVTAEDRARDALTADEFFSRVRTPADLVTLRAESATPPHLLEALKRDNARARVEFRRATAPNRDDRAWLARAHAAEERAREDARLDAIARAINDQHRHGPRDPAPASRDTPVTAHPSTNRGLTR